MTVLDAADVVDRLRVVGPNQGSHDVPKMLARGLPVTRLARHAVLVVRHVAVDVLDAGHVGSEVGGAVDDLVGRAARPRAGRVRGATDAVLFADESEFLACLLRDLADGSAPGNWWWSHLGIDPSSSIGAAIERRARVTPAAFGHLDRWGAAEDVAEAMDQADASLAVAALRAEHRLDRGESDMTVLRSDGPDQRSNHPAADHGPKAELRSVVDALAIRHGRPVVFGTADRSGGRTADRVTISTPYHRSDLSRRPRIDDRQATALLAEDHAESTSTRLATDAVETRAQRRRIGGARSDQEREETSGPDPGSDADEADRPADQPDRRPLGHPTRSRTRSGTEQRRTASDTGAPAASTRPSADLQHRDGGSSAEVSAHGETDDRVPDDEPYDLDRPDPLGIETSFAGLFYLLNPIRRLGSSQPAHEANAVWRLLAGLGVRLVPPIADDRLWPLLLELATGSQRPGPGPEHPDPAWLDRANDAVIAYLTEGLGLDSASIVGMVSVPGVVTHTDTNLDIDLALDDVDLDARRHGLDADPGWYPETGLVIRFHFHRGDH